MKTNDTQETNVKPKNRLLRTFKKHKILFFLFLFFALGTNVFAWFVFNSIVSMNITGHVRAWDISIGEDGQTWDVNLKDLYPGMTTITEETKLSNNGESAANVELNVLEYKLFGETYSSVRESSDGKIYTPQELYDTLTSYYPFILTISSNANSVRAGEKITITVDCEWPYDGTRTNPDDDTSTPDGWDTYWGNKAYEYYETVGSTEKSLEIQIEIKTTQVK